MHTDRRWNLSSGLVLGGFFGHGSSSETEEELWWSNLLNRFNVVVVDRVEREGREGEELGGSVHFRRQVTVGNHDSTQNWARMPFKNKLDLQTAHTFIYNTETSHSPSINTRTAETRLSDSK